MNFFLEKELYSRFRLVHEQCYALCLSSWTFHISWTFWMFMNLSYFRLVHELLRLMFEFMNFAVLRWTKCLGSWTFEYCSWTHEISVESSWTHEFYVESSWTHEFYVESSWTSWMLLTGSWTWWTIVNIVFMNCIHEPIWWTFDEYWQVIHEQFMNDSWMFIISWMFMNSFRLGTWGVMVDRTEKRSKICRFKKFVTIQWIVYH